MAQTTASASALRRLMQQQLTTGKSLLALAQLTERAIIAGDTRKLEALEPESRAYTGQRRAEYALYRGLVHLALGDRGAAGVWLREAKAVEDVQPHTLGGEDKARLDVALESLAAP